MKSFNDFFTEKEIISYLCKLRAKLSKKRSKKHLLHVLTTDAQYNYHKTSVSKVSDFELVFVRELSELLPSRRQWKDLGKESRYKNNSNGVRQKLVSVEKNIYCIQKSILYFKIHKPNEPFLKKLYEFIKSIQSDIQNPAFRFQKPTVFPKPKLLKRESQLKEEETNVCRPICHFKLKVRVILSFTNKFLTQLFDIYFSDASLAFRAVTNNKFISHHTAIEKIIDYKKKFSNDMLWTAECDMKKFYDRVSHRIVLDKFNKLILKVKTDIPDIDLTAAKRLFYRYLDCYSFNGDALIHNSSEDHWKKYNIPKGEYGWVLKDLQVLNYYSAIPVYIWSKLKRIEKTKVYNRLKNWSCRIKKNRIGIPQGGALSGLIANIVLDSTDRETIGNSGIFYIRFCDDMILLNRSFEVCNQAIKRYKNSLEKLKLVPHEFSGNLVKPRLNKIEYLGPISSAPFWIEKSKGPFKWGPFMHNSFPWIGFVGYEIDYNLNVRIRKSSMEKELKKQYEVVYKIKQAVKSGKNARNGKISESAINRLIGMSVGRVELWNYKVVESEMCWKNGFESLNINKYSVKQLKQLDRNRNKLFYDLKQYLASQGETVPKDTNPPNREIVNFDKPFSYYYHFVEK